MSCPDCTAGEVLPGEPLGHSSTLGSYFTPGSEEHPKSAIVLLTDVFGLPLKNCKIIADHLAKETGFDVWIPDYFGGWPIYPLSRLKATGRTGGKTTFFQWILFYLSVIPSFPAFIHSRPAVSDQRVVEFVAAVKQEKKYEKMGVVGYCFGGASVVRLSSRNIFQAGVVCHPGPFTLDEAKSVKIPVSWVCAEEDQFFAAEKRLQLEAMFSQKKDSEDAVDYEFRDYKGKENGKASSKLVTRSTGTVHGFAIRPDLTVPDIKGAYEGSLNQIKSWFVKTLSV
ncbi:hypothetical protein H0H93_008053 [Arthromyces matolae]|nr:hypothetical protein H0H93_008053 [Arthromyces matolae]